MENVAEFYQEFKKLDQKGLISLKWIKIWFFSLLIVFICLLFIWNLSFPDTKYEKNHVQMLKFNKKSKKWFGINAIHVSLIVSTSNEKQEKLLEMSLLTMKSVILFSTKVVHFHIFADDVMYQLMLSRLNDWPIDVLHRASFTFKSVFTSETPNGFKPLHIPLSFYYLNELMYVEPGVLFVDSIDFMWDKFIKKKSTPYVLSIGLNNFKYNCPISEKLSYGDLVYDESVIMFNLKLLRRSSIIFPVHQANISKHHISLRSKNCSKYNGTSWSSVMIEQLYALVEEHISKHETNYWVLNLIALFNPSLVDVVSYYRSKKVTSSSNYTLSNYWITPLLSPKRWNFMSNIIKQSEFSNYSSNSGLIKFINIILSV